MEEAIEKFSSLLQVDIVGIMGRFVSFINTDVPLIVEYYQGSDNPSPSDSFLREKEVTKEMKELYKKITANPNFFTKIGDWDLMTVIEDGLHQLNSVLNVSKYLRSISDKNGPTEFSLYPYTQKQNQTIEEINRVALGDPDWSDSWFDTSFSNGLREEDYTDEGGKTLVLTVGGSRRQTFFLESVIDNITVDNLYGRDIDRNFHYQDNDIGILSPHDTMYQGVKILSNLRQGDNPEFPESGIQQGTFIGGNYALMNFPVLTRQLTDTFATDDTIRSFKVDKLKLSSDKLLLDFTVETVKGEFLAIPAEELIPRIPGGSGDGDFNDDFNDDFD